MKRKKKLLWDTVAGKVVQEACYGRREGPRTQENTTLIAYENYFRPNNIKNYIYDAEFTFGSKFGKSNVFIHRCW